MCGRFLATAGPDELARFFSARAPEVALPARFNIAPTNEIYAVFETAPGERRVETFRWGLVPGWAKDTRIASTLVNARSETVAEKPSFRNSFRRHRCLIPMSGFYEWHGDVPSPTDPTGRKRIKQPFRIMPRSEPILAAAGLWATWRDPSADRGDWLHTCTIITTEANGTMRPYHDRMPAFLDAESWESWLSPETTSAERLLGLLAPAPDDLLVVEAVSTDVNNVRNTGPFPSAGR
jgi:putative SOS response-associated peptidase YedK